MANKVKEGDAYLLPAEVTKLSDDGMQVTLRISAYGYPITIPVTSLEGLEKGRRK